MLIHTRTHKKRKLERFGDISLDISHFLVLQTEIRYTFTTDCTPFTIFFFCFFFYDSTHNISNNIRNKMSPSLTQSLYDSLTRYQHHPDLKIRLNQTEVSDMRRMVSPTTKRMSGFHSFFSTVVDSSRRFTVVCIYGHKVSGRELSHTRL